MEQERLDSIASPRGIVDDVLREGRACGKGRGLILGTIESEKRRGEFHGSGAWSG
jgi:hypothetical protein